MRSLNIQQLHRLLGYHFLETGKELIEYVVRSGLFLASEFKETISKTARIMENVTSLSDHFGPVSIRQNNCKAQ